MISRYFTCLIFGKTLNDSRKFLESIVEKMNYDDILEMRMTMNNYQVILKDGTIYRTVSLSDSPIGLKCQKAYIQEGMDEGVINCMIIPTIIPFSLYKDQVEYYKV